MWVPVLVAVCLLAAWGGALPSRGSRNARPMPGGRIISGKPVNISQFPWHVSVLRYDYHFICSGSIITARWVLTAAHCIDYDSADYDSADYDSADYDSADYDSADYDSADWYQVRAGSSKWDEGGTVYRVDYLILHESFSWATADYDIGLIMIRGTFSFSDKVKMVNLATFEPKAGTSVTVTGMGPTETESYPYVLLALTSKIQERSSCNTTYGGEITERMICAGVEEDGMHPCWKGLGGPLVACDTQHGVASWGWGGGEQGYPGVYTSVAALRSWIREKAGV